MTQFHESNIMASESTQGADLEQTKGQGAIVQPGANLEVLEAFSRQLTPGLDRSLRRYARYLDPIHGEDGYHNAICSILVHPRVIDNVSYFLKVRIKSAIMNIWKHERVEREYCERYYMNAPDPREQNKPQDVCKRGHRLTVDNVYKVKYGKTCKQCKQERARNRPKQKPLHTVNN